MLIPAGFEKSTLTSGMCQYINLLVDEYSLRTISKKKPVIGLDDLYLFLYTHWVLDDSTFKDKRQRVQVATGLLTAAFFGCRPCSLFDTRVKIDEPDGSDVPTDDTAVASAQKGRKAVKDIKMDASNHVKNNRDSDSNTPWDGDGDGDTDTDTDTVTDTDNDSDSGSLYNCDKDCDTDNDYNAGPEKTRLFLYRHFIISIVANPTPEKLNLVFVKAILLHTKGKKNNPRM
ncbi:hypothetical protein MMC30_008698 [Trapelia coarctata]|nr:hypothetical protein [Trapelia coarctata]